MFKRKNKKRKDDGYFATAQRKVNEDFLKIRNYALFVKNSHQDWTKTPQASIDKLIKQSRFLGNAYLCAVLASLVYIIFYYLYIFNGNNASLISSAISYFVICVLLTTLALQQFYNVYCLQKREFPPLTFKMFKEIITQKKR